MRVTAKQRKRINRLFHRVTFISVNDEWKEENHKRDENGRFSSSGESSTPKIPTLNGNELGRYKDIKELRSKARLYALEHLAGKKFKNKSTGNEISVAMGGVKHTIVGASEELIKTIPAIPEILETAQLLKTEPDKNDDPNSLGVEIYQAKLMIENQNREVIITVKHWKDGRRYYDHGYMKKA